MSIVKNTLSQTAYWQVNKCIAKCLKSLNATVLLSYLIDSYLMHKDSCVLIDSEEFFYRKSSDIEDDTTLSYREQKTAIEILVQNELVKTKLMGVPAKLHFALNEIKIEQILKTSFDKSAKLDSTKAQNYIIRTNNKKEKEEVENFAIAQSPPSTSPLIEKNSFNWSLVKESLTAEQADAAVRDLLSDPPTREKIFQTAMWNGSEEDLQAFIPKFCSRAIEQYGKKIQSKYSLITELEIWLGKEKHFASSETHRFNAEQFKSHYEAYVSKIEKLSPQAKQDLLNKREAWSKYINETFIPKLNEYKFLSTYDGLNTQDFAYIAVKYNKGPHFKIVLECIAQIADTKKYVSFRRLREAIDKAFEDATKQK